MRREMPTNGSWSWSECRPRLLPNGSVNGCGVEKSKVAEVSATQDRRGVSPFGAISRGCHAPTPNVIPQPLAEVAYWWEESPTGRVRKGPFRWPALDEKSGRRCPFDYLKCNVRFAPVSTTSSTTSSRVAVAVVKSRFAWERSQVSGPVAGVGRGPTRCGVVEVTLASSTAARHRAGPDGHPLRCEPGGMPVRKPSW